MFTAFLWEKNGNKFECVRKLIVQTNSLQNSQGDIHEKRSGMKEAMKKHKKQWIDNQVQLE